MQALLFSDLHCHSHKQSLTRLDDCLETLRWVFKTAVNENIPNVIFLGDLFQDRQKIHILSYHKTYEIVEQYCKSFNLYLLLGNHDMWYNDRTDVNSIYPFSGLNNVHLISEPDQVIIGGVPIDFLPYTNNPIESIKKLSQKREKASKVLCGHLAINGAQLNTFHRIAEVSIEYEGDMVPVDQEMFSPWERVFLGHYHGEQRLGHIEYVGSPLQLNFAEAFQKKHIIVLDLESLDTQYIENQFSPKHLILNEDRLLEYDLDNCFLKICPKDITSIGLVELKSQLLNDYNIRSIEFAVPKEQEDVEQQIVDAKYVLVKDSNEMLQRYIEAKGSNGLDSKRLLSVGQELCQRSQID